MVTEEIPFHTEPEKFTYLATFTILVNAPNANEAAQLAWDILHDNFQHDAGVIVTVQIAMPERHYLIGADITPTLVDYNAPNANNPTPVP